MTASQFLLYPFSLLYGTVMDIRNRLYDRQQFSSKTFPLPVISVGNLTVGGTGKTPHVEYILRLLRGKKTATLSRGYKRRSKGFILADNKASAATIGDEPFQYFQDFPEVTVAVAENRATGIRQLCLQKPDLEVIVLDDAFQHRGVAPSLNILLTDYYRLFYNDMVLPAGRLREFPAGAARADVIVVSKCPEDLVGAAREDIRQEIYRQAGKITPVFFSHYRYGTPVACGLTKPISKHILLVTAIANPQPLVAYLERQGYQVRQHYPFPDHYLYTSSDLQKIYSDWQRYSQETDITVFTTRKDATKLTDPAFQNIWQQLPLFYIPVKVAFAQNQADFDALILNHLAGRSNQEIN